MTKSYRETVQVMVLPPRKMKSYSYQMNSRVKYSAHSVLNEVRNLDIYTLRWVVQENSQKFGQKGIYKNASCLPRTPSKRHQQSI